MHSLKTDRIIVEHVLFEDTLKIRDQFSNSISEYLPRIRELLAEGIYKLREFEEFAGGKEECEKVSHLILGVIQGSLVSMRLFLDGLLIQSGNTQRQVLESIAMAVLCSKPNFGYLERFSNGKFSSSKAIQTLITRYSDYGVKKEAVEELKEGAKFYDKFSHLSLMTIALNSSFRDPDTHYFGGYFDQEKIPQYKLEAESRVRLLSTYSSLIDGIKSNLGNDR